MIHFTLLMDTFLQSFFFFMQYKFNCNYYIAMELDHHYLAIYAFKVFTRESSAIQSKLYIPLK